MLACLLMQSIGCSKLRVEVADETNVKPNTTAQRIVEIDRLLSQPLTGKPDDADQRATLRAERAALSGEPAQRSQPVMQAQRQSEPVRNNAIIVARDARGDREPQRLSNIEAMTPSERERYYREIKLRNPNYVVPTYYSR